MIRFRIGREVLPDCTGVNLVAELLNVANILAQIPESPRGARGPDQTYSNQDMVRIAIASFAAGQPDYIDIEEFHCHEDFYGDFLTPHGKLPAESTFRTRLEDLANVLADSKFQVITEANAALLKSFRIDPGALKIGNFLIVPVDLDVSPFDNSKTKKEGLGRTYKQVDGFSPMFVYIGTHGLPILVEFREGTQHCQRGTPDLLMRLLPLALSLTDKPLLFRFDSGNDAADNMWILSEDPRCRFLIKRNFRKLDRDDIALHLMNVATTVEKPREGKTVYTGSTAQTFVRTVARGKKETLTTRVVFQITERISTYDGQMLIAPEREIDMWYTNLDKEEASDLEIIELYHNHGTSEQYHSEFKTDLDLERLPSGKFNANALLLTLSMISFNCLRIIELLAREMPKGSPIHYRNTKRRRLITIIEKLIQIPCHFTKHARRKNASLGRNPWAEVFLYVLDRIRSFATDHRRTSPVPVATG